MFTKKSVVIDSGPPETTTEKKFKTSNSLALTFLKARNLRPGAMFSLCLIITLLALP